MLYIPVKNYYKKRWEVDFPDRDKEMGDINYVISEYLFDGFIYEYNCDGKRNHEHSISAILEDILNDVRNGHEVDIKGFEHEYSEQEINIINKLIKKLSKDMSKYDINNIINKINKETLKPVFKCNIEEADKLSIYDSKIGGKPFWKNNLEYPTLNGNPLILLAQINFKDLPDNDIFPSTGILQFFIANDEMCGLWEKGGSFVIYHETLDDVKDINITYKNSVFSPIIKEGRMTFNLTEESISSGDIKFVKEYNKLFDKDLDDILYDILDDRCNGGWGNKLLGYPAFTQCDVEDRYKKGYDTLLFQLDSDYKFTNWGDSGIGNFFINSEKLKSHDFSDVLYNWDCC